MFSYVKWLQSYKVAKLEIKKKLGQFGFEATFFATLCSKSLLSERPGFESRPAQTLKAYNLAAPCPAGMKIDFS